MKPIVSWDQINDAISYIGMQHHLTVQPIGLLPNVSSTGLTLMKAPGIVIYLPYPEENTEYIDALCILFHEWGHFLDIIDNLGDGDNFADLNDLAIRYYESVVKIIPEKGEARLLHESLAWDLGLKGLESIHPPLKGLKKFLDESEFLDSDKSNILNRYSEVKSIGLISYSI